MLRVAPKDCQASDTTLNLQTFLNGFSCSSFLSSNSLCLTRAMTKISQLAWHAKHALFLLKLLRTLRSKCQKLQWIAHALPELCQILQLCAGSTCPALPWRCWGYCTLVGVFWHPSQAPLAALFHMLLSKCATSSLPCSIPSNKQERVLLHSQF